MLLCKEIPDHLDRGRLRRKRLGRLEKTHRRLGDRPNSWATTFRHQRRFLRKGIDQGVANSILVKVNQIGTLTETWRSNWPRKTITRP